MKTIDLPNATIQLYENFFEEHFFEELKELIQWQEKEIILFGKKIMQPRLVAFYGDENVSYKYSGQSMIGERWSDALLQIKNKIKAELNFDFNSCLCNYYRDGNDSMGWHQDNEKELGQNPTIVSVSFGGERLFKLKHTNKPMLKEDILLSNGSLLVMSGETQHFYKHAILKTKKLVVPRINLTFRTIL